jgi:hypothetical protein
LNLNNIDISNNYITGTLNMEIFKLPEILTFVSHINCMDGVELPVDICAASKLQVLVLDGLKTAKICRNLIFPPSLNFPSTYTTAKNVIKGGIPDCMFNMSSLITLSLSGNRMTGTLSESIIISPVLKNISLSNNEFHGEIPQVFFDHSWIYINLGFNKLKGIISNSIRPLKSNESLILENNRLSGDIPKSLYHSKIINILKGNIFQCNPFDPLSTLPENDQNSLNYECGSNTYNFAVVFSLIIFICMWMLKTRAWKAITRFNKETNLNRESNSGKQSTWFDWIMRLKLLLSVIVFFPRLFNNKLYILRAAGDNITYMSAESFSVANSTSFDSSRVGESKRKVVDEPIIDSRISIDNREESFARTNITSLCELADGIWSILMYYSFYLFLIILPSATVLKYNYSTITNSYSFITSFLNISGSLPGYFVMSMMTISMMVVYILIQIYLPKPGREDKLQLSHEYLSFKPTLNQKLRRYIALLIVALIDIVIMIILNLFYVYSTLTFNSRILFFIAFGVALFKTFYKNHALPFTIKKSTKMFSFGDDQFYINRKHKSDVIVQCGLGIINNIVIPFISTAAISPGCFYNAINQSDAVESSYSFSLCDWFDTNDNSCGYTRNDVETTSYFPPFNYSYSWYIYVILYSYCLILFFCFYFLL